MILMKEEILLPLIIALGCFLTFYPHFNYPYPLHVDEWFHIAEAKMIATGQKTDWYSGKPFNLGMERGWHLTLSSIQLLFNLGSRQWVFVPMLIHVIAILATYLFALKLLGKRQAILAAFLTAIIPSNLTIGGPIFLVPVNLSMIFIPFSLLLAFGLVNIDRKIAYVILTISLTYLLYSHPPSAMALLVILGIYLVLLFVGRDPEFKILLISVLVSIFLSIPNYIQEVQNKGLESGKFSFWITLEGIPNLYGIFPTILFLVGFYFLSQRKKKEFLCIMLSTIFLLINIVLFVNLKVNYLIPYQRIYIPLFVLMNVIASEGFIKALEIKKKKLGLFIFFILLGIAAYFSIAERVKTQLYYLIDQKDFENFLWMRENVGEDQTVILDPWKARAFPVVGEKKVYAVMPFGPDEKEMTKVNQTYDFLRDCSNTSFLVENNISVVYSRNACINGDLVEVKESIYVLR